jgi:hypothetical protein
MRMGEHVARRQWTATDVWDFDQQAAAAGNHAQSAYLMCEMRAFAVRSVNKRIAA